ncbi:hypothetical protein V1264_024655 [Littorina saxatilis]|uniref:Uncharacterized protein n=1 Tax=Littorina saxatilis TaxID=31220 RepID=A0AAN9ALQ5_9CAEN
MNRNVGINYNQKYHQPRHQHPSIHVQVHIKLGGKHKYVSAIVETKDVSVQCNLINAPPLKRNAVLTLKCGNR